MEERKVCLQPHMGTLHHFLLFLGLLPHSTAYARHLLLILGMGM